MTESKTDRDVGSGPGLISKYTSRDRLPGLKAQLMFWGLLAGGLVLDLWSKKAVFDRLAYGEDLTVIGGLLRLVPALNNGAAFGICAGKPFLLTAASIIAMVIVLGYFLFSGIRQRLVQVSLGLLAAGICGNLFDRIFNEGFVRDFIDVYINAFGRERHWHTFNIADVLLCVGVGLLILWTGVTGKSAQKPAQQRK